MSKIKSVTLLKDLPGCKAGHIIEANHSISHAFGFDYPLYMIKNNPDFFENNPDFFEIEYEQEKQYIDFRVVCDKTFCTNTITGRIERVLRNDHDIADVKVTETGRGEL